MVGRARAHLGLLVLIGLVVMLATLLTSAIAPLTERTADRAIAADVRDAGLQGAVVATVSRPYDEGQRIRDPKAVAELRESAASAQRAMPDRLAAVVRPGVTSLTSPSMHLLDAGPGRYLRLAYLTAPGAAPAVTYTSGGPPGPSVPAAKADVEVTVTTDPWPVQVALPREAADALGLQVGDRVEAEDEQHRTATIVISGIFVAGDRDDHVWAAVPELLHPIIGRSDQLTSVSAAAIVSTDSLPDFQLALPFDDLTTRVVFSPQPSQVRWKQTERLMQAIVSLKTSGSRGSSEVSWDSLLDQVLLDSRATVSAAQGQATVLIVGLLAGVTLILVLAADLVVRRRSDSLVLMRERGASLMGIFSELAAESVVVALVGSALGTLVTWLLVGDVGWRWSLPVLVIATLAGPVLATTRAARAADDRRVPANRSARRAVARARSVRRLLVEGVVLAVAVLTYVALHQRGVVGDGDLTASSAPTWFAIVGGLLLVRVLPPATRLVLARARRVLGAVPLVVAARTSRSAGRALPLLVVAVTVAQLTTAVALVATEQHGQAAGALQSVGGDASWETAPDRSVSAAAAKVSSSAGVRAAAAARVVEGFGLASGSSSATVRLVIVDSTAYQRVLAASPLPDAPQLARLHRRADGKVPALLLGGDRDLRDDLQVRWEDTPVPLTVVGVAPRVGDSTEPVLVIDRAEFESAGVVADPGTVWAVGPGAAAALKSAAGTAGTVDVLTDVVDARRSAPLASGLVRLAVASAVLLLMFAVLGVALAAAAEAPVRAESLGRLRSLGLGRLDVRRVLLGELVSPVVVGAVAGVVLGAGAAVVMFGSLSLELITGQSATPGLVVPWWTSLTVVGLVGTAMLIAVAEAARVGRLPLAALLRGGDQR
ncbi:FtsX-like permease family protein [Aeromicrobium ginsengisoli]|uniref:FtsX-like permease family protein n=1 Tax=Aeromicrobium ginsengisoli TaxID=363867 RepID=A0A5M4FDI9_9ACTN|nr:FtsX-like permease family protein [Aeromicrobium ginsengisoli]KAA1397260.1 FtsX-like permease family protein [Aeromicrobium ginsengisoli]